MDNQKQICFHNPIYLIEYKFLKLYLLVGFMLRIVLMTISPTYVSFSLTETLRLLGVGVLSDLGMGILLFIPLQVVYLGLNEWKYGKITGWTIEALLVVALFYTFCCHSVFDEYGGGAPIIAKIFLSWKLVSFSIRFFFSKLREGWRRISLYATWGMYVFLFLCVSIGEIMFWTEFGVRYNFIAVDYLVYTNEVIGNIIESYSITPILLLVLAATIGIIAYHSHRQRMKVSELYSPRLLAIHLGLYGIMAVVSYYILCGTHSLESGNQYVTQLEQNGACNFVIAFRNNQLEYDKFYPMLPKQETVKLYRQMAGFRADGIKTIGDTATMRRPNIVLITVESLSADFLARYGNKSQLTPQLDQLMQKSLVFDSLYAVGNRTVRGLEALSLCIPPSAGESIIKRKDNRMGTLSVGAVLGKVGYKCQFLYGGDSYFDNMGDFFSHNGYEVIDRKNINRNNVTFSNIWGVCDEDIFNEALKVFDKDANQGKPFFAQIMTTSNHRPYTYPKGRIKTDGNPYTREAAVRYTDYAIGKLIDEASHRPWFYNTVFVIIADHCASSAGKTSIPIDCYHIPCIVYAPHLVKPQTIDKLCSQIDIMPTLLSLLQIKTQVGFAGQDVLASSFHPRAFMATYQDLGYLEGDKLIVLSPVRKIRRYTVRTHVDGSHEELADDKEDRQLERKAQAYYQYANLYQKYLR